MDEDQMNRLMMLVSVVAACCAGLATVGLLIATAVEGLHLLIPAVLAGVVTVGTVYGATVFGSRTTGKTKVFSAEIEREVLTPKQRRELRKARGEVVLERAMIDISHEKANIIHGLQLEAGDDTKPPHETTFSPRPEQRQQELRRKTTNHYDQDY